MNILFADRLLPPHSALTQAPADYRHSDANRVNGTTSRRSVTDPRSPVYHTSYSVSPRPNLPRAWSSNHRSVSLMTHDEHQTAQAAARFGYGPLDALQLQSSLLIPRNNKGHGPYACTVPF